MKKIEIFNDVCVIKPDIFSDERGSFQESYNYKAFSELGFNEEFIQDNISFSKTKNTIRGLHFQSGAYSQSKLLRVLEGEIQDVFIDLRVDSKFYEKHYSINLSKDSGWVYIPKGYAHGFCTLSNNTSVLYKVDKPYSVEHDSGIRWNDSFFGINWNINDNDPVISSKDKELPFWNDIKEASIF